MVRQYRLVSSWLGLCTILLQVTVTFYSPLSNFVLCNVASLLGGSSNFFCVFLLRRFKKLCCVVQIVASLGCSWTFNAQNDVCTESDTSNQFLNSSAEGLKCLCAHLKSQFKTCTSEHDFVTSQIVCKPVFVQNTTYTSVMWKPPVHTYTESRLQDILCPAVKLWGEKIIFIV